MCCCDKPTINGTMGYKWQPNDAASIYPTNPPTLRELDMLLYDEPGRCGGQDSHSHHYCLVQRSGLELLYKHGGGEGRIRLSNNIVLHPILAALDSPQRYWVLNSLYHAYSEGRDKGIASERHYWMKAAMQKRIKTRKQPQNRGVKVWVTPELVTAGMTP